MAYLRVKSSGGTFVLTPHILGLVISDIYRQLPGLTVNEIAEYLKALGFSDIREEIPIAIRQHLEQNAEQIDKLAEESDMWGNSRFWAENFFYRCADEARVKRHTKAAKSLRTIDQALHNPYFKELLFKILEKHGFNITESRIIKEIREIIDQ